MIKKILIILMIASPCMAIVVSDDPALHEFTPEFAGVGYLSSSGGTSGVLITPRHVLTAAHAVGDIRGKTFRLESQTFDLLGVFYHPHVDLAIVQLVGTANHPGYEINTQLNEVGSDVILAGFGESGVGQTQPDEYPRGVGRYGTNVIDSSIAGFLVSDFDFGDVTVTLGDSGGPTFMRIDGELRIVGIHAGMTDNDGDGVFGEYGDSCYDIRVAAYMDWINQVLPLPGDANGDGQVSVGDYASVQHNFGNTYHPIVFPEPRVVWVLAIGLLAGKKRRLR